MRNEFIGKWRFTEMDAWDLDFIDMIAPGYIQFSKNDTGEFKFGCVYGFMDCRTEENGDKDKIEFTWEGNDEADPAFGRGWAEVEENTLKGHIYFHQGDDSGFKAVRIQDGDSL